MSSSVIREAVAADLDRLGPIEDQADTLFASLPSIGAWPPAPSGSQRASLPGFVLVVSETAHSEALGFIHILQTSGAGHIEQLSVAPAATRRGYGRALVEAAKLEGAKRGYRRLTLRTFADIPWNAPFYRTCGFKVSDPDTDFLMDLVQVEEQRGLAAQGRRVQMEVDLA